LALDAGIVGALLVGALQIRVSNIRFLSPGSESLSNNLKYSSFLFIRKALMNSIQSTTASMVRASNISPSSPSNDKGAGGLSADTAAALSDTTGAGDLTVDTAAECLDKKTCRESISPSFPSSDTGAGGHSADTAAALSGKDLKSCA
jgi:hypothetical protein